MINLNSVKFVLLVKVKIVKIFVYCAFVIMWDTCRIRVANNVLLHASTQSEILKSVEDKFSSFDDESIDNSWAQAAAKQSQCR